jgi:hypothetical protein
MLSPGIGFWLASFLLAGIGYWHALELYSSHRVDPDSSRQSIGRIFRGPLFGTSTEDEPTRLLRKRARRAGLIAAGTAILGGPVVAILDRVLARAGVADGLPPSSHSNSLIVIIWLALVGFWAFELCVALRAEDGWTSGRNGDLLRLTRRQTVILSTVAIAASPVFLAVAQLAGIL